MSNWDKSPTKTESWFGFKSTKDLKERWDWYKLEKKVVTNPNPEPYFDEKLSAQTPSNLAEKLAETEALAEKQK